MRSAPSRAREAVAGGWSSARRAADVRVLVPLRRRWGALAGTGDPVGRPAPVPARSRAAGEAGSRRPAGRVRRLAAAGMAFWRRSLQFRVVATTLVASTVVVVALGLVVVHRVTDGLVEEKVVGALAEVTSGQVYLRDQLGDLGGPDAPDLNPALQTAATNLSARGKRSGDFAVAIETDNRRLPGRYVPLYRAENVIPPPELAARIRNDNVVAYQFTRTSLDGGAPRPFLVAAAPVRTQAGRFDLYHFYPLDNEVSTVALVQNSIGAIGGLLLVLLAGIVAFVTRQVVTPVRLAARTAERLSAGLLEERMAVHGEDDLARLAHSFNQMAENLQRQIEQLEDLSRLQRRFTSDVSHELRTPLTTVRMAADMIDGARAGFPPELARSSELLSTELDRFESLLADLLEISRYDGGFAVLDAEEVDVRALVDRTVGGLGPVADQAGSTIRVVAPAEPVVAEVDPRRVERILRNLLGNAIEHGEGRPVVVTLASDDDAVAVTVRDHGVGLKPGETQTVFNRFWRADPSRARKTGGTGLGLSISLEDARLHGGWLQAWGRPGGGAQFRLTLPLRVDGRLSRSPLSLEPAKVDPAPAGATPGPAVPVPSGSDGTDGTARATTAPSPVAPAGPAGPTAPADVLSAHRHG